MRRRGSAASATTGPFERPLADGRSADHSAWITKTATPHSVLVFAVVSPGISPTPDHRVRRRGRRRPRRSPLQPRASGSRGPGVGVAEDGQGHAGGILVEDDRIGPAPSRPGDKPRRGPRRAPERRRGWPGSRRRRAPTQGPGTSPRNSISNALQGPAGADGGPVSRPAGQNRKVAAVCSGQLSGLPQAASEAAMAIIRARIR